MKTSKDLVGPIMQNSHRNQSIYLANMTSEWLSPFKQFNEERQIPIHVDMQQSSWQIRWFDNNFENDIAQKYFWVSLIHYSDVIMSLMAS